MGQVGGSAEFSKSREGASSWRWEAGIHFFFKWVSLHIFTSILKAQQNSYYAIGLASLNNVSPNSNLSVIVLKQLIPD